MCGFWLALTAKQIADMHLDNIKFIPGKGASIKIIREDKEATKNLIPYLDTHCPVQALQSWINLAPITSGQVFRSIDVWGAISLKAMQPKSIAPLLSNIVKENDFDIHVQGNSLRRGFVEWAVAQNWPVESIIKHVGRSGLRMTHRALNEIDCENLLTLLNRTANAK